MKMPCKCEDTDEARVLKERGLPTAELRFIGGFNKTPSGPYAQYETGKVYVVHAKFANQEIYPYWEPCEKEESEDSLIENQDGIDESEIEDESSEGLNTLGFTINQGGDMTESAGFSEQEAIMGMDKATLQSYIVGNNGKVDARWGRKRLIQEALKL